VVAQRRASPQQITYSKPFALSEVEGSGRAKAKCSRLRSKEGFDFAQPERFSPGSQTNHTTPKASMASATFLKPAMFAPFT